MCKALKVPRSTVYYKSKPKTVDCALENAVIDEFRKSWNNFGTRKLKIMLARRSFHASRRKIGKIMRKYDLISNYTIRNKKKRKAVPNNDDIPNILNREFNEKSAFEVVVSDLTYVKIAGKWRYLCLLLDLCGRKIVGSAAGNQRNAKLVQTAFYSIQTDLRRISLLHTDRGSEFKNQVVDEILTAFNIKRSLSAKGTPHDNAVIESLYSQVKTEFPFQREFADLAEFELLWFEYVNWFNFHRPHGSLGYKTPAQFRGE